VSEWPRRRRSTVDPNRPYKAEGPGSIPGAPTANTLVSETRSLSRPRILVSGASKEHVRGAGTLGLARNLGSWHAVTGTPSIGVMTEPPRTRYATYDGVHIAFQVVGEGDLDLLLIDTWVHHVEAVWDFPDYARFLRRLNSFGRVIHFDRRGTGLSDPVPLDRLPDLETQVGDAVAVLEQSGSGGAAVIGLNDGSLFAVLMAARHPRLVRSLVLFTMTGAHTLAAGFPMESIDDVLEMIKADALADNSGVEFLAPSRVGDERFDRDLRRLQRLSVRPGAYAHYYRQTMEADVRDVLPSIQVPTLVLNRTRNRIVPIEQSREAAAAIPGARFVELPGTDHLAFSEGVDELLDEIEEFLTGTRSGRDPDRILTTLLFTDIVDSTTRAVEMGDRRWRALLDQHHDVMRRELERFGGRVVSTTGDGFFVSFDRPVAAVRCALAAVEAMTSLGLQIRGGVHTGEAEVRGTDLGGLAVHIAARVAAAAHPSEVLVSSTVKDLLAGSNVRFLDRGEHELKGVPGTWRFYAAAPA
jgi:class 3 adenylate cyclase